MNKLLEQFVEQAEEWALEHSDDQDSYDIEFRKKFAKLIVKEAASVCLAQRDPPNLNYKPSEHFAEVIKRHFK